VTAGLLVLAVVNGQRSAQSRQVVKDVSAITQALEYFYQDQNRYPAIGEFEDQNVMRQYLSNFPPQEFTSGVCPQSFGYANTFRNDYELRFCLSKGVRGYQAGWNVIKSPVK
ncbi:MAG TPA: hypothetical protein PKD79_04080, partial [Candidatus Doudnabacteria bacterium]|nr:hypothetical protein [Candidatus Doudnabacteria bacterium]